MRADLPDRLEKLMTLDANERPALLREAALALRALRDAPVGYVIGQAGPDNLFTKYAGAIVQMDDPASVKGQRVRLVVVGGEG